jgi:hypothetical protein
MPAVRPYVDMTKATAAFAAGVNYLSRLTGVDRRKIVLGEAGSILKACAADTKVATPDSVRKGATLRALRGAGLTRGGQFTVNAGVRGPYGRVFMLKKGDGKNYRRTHDENFKPLNQHYKDSDWLALKQTVEFARAKIRRARAKAAPSAALARGSWVRIADAAGIRLEEVPGGRLSATQISAARAAVARRGAERNNGLAFVRDEPLLFVVTLVNRYPGADRLGFQTMLAAKVSGRARFMMTAVKKGFDGSIKDMQRLFPGWTAKLGNN